MNVSVYFVSDINRPEHLRADDDIKLKGFRVVEFTGFVTDEAVKHVQ